MINPILSALYKGRAGQINGVMNLLTGAKDPNQLFDQMVKTNPQFADFVKQNQGKTPEQIAQEYGIDFSLLKGLIK